MSKKSIFFTLLFLLFFIFYSHTEETRVQNAPTQGTREEIFIAPIVETLKYSINSIAAGSGFSIGYGSESAVGIKFLYVIDTEQFIFLEFLAFFRLYFFDIDAAGTNSIGNNPIKGPFIQVNGGPVFFAKGKPEHTGHGSISAGLAAGWRFPFGKSWYVEPAIRAGYPYIIGGGVSGGFRL